MVGGFRLRIFQEEFDDVVVPTLNAIDHFVKIRLLTAIENAQRLAVEAETHIRRRLWRGIFGRQQRNRARLVRILPFHGIPIQFVFRIRGQTFQNTLRRTAQMLQ